jgi:hypothetical protein
MPSTPGSATLQHERGIMMWRLIEACLRWGFASSTEWED